MSNQDLSQLRICVQKFHHRPEAHVEIANAVQDVRQRAIFQRGTFWPSGTTITVSFVYGDDLPSWYDIGYMEKVAASEGEHLDEIEYRVRKLSMDQAVKTIVQERVAPQVPALNFSFVEMNGMVRVRFDRNGGSSSLVGTQCLQVPADEHTMTFGWLDVATITHEFSHALGMLHEHQNPAGGIQWDAEKVYAWAARTQGWDRAVTYENILKPYASNEITGSVYDPRSIMLYFFPAELTLNGKGTRENLRYSDTDRKWLNSIYSIPGKPAPVPTPNTPTPPGKTAVSPQPKIVDTQTQSVTGDKACPVTFTITAKCDDNSKKVRILLLISVSILTIVLLVLIGALFKIL